MNVLDKHLVQLSIARKIKRRHWLERAHAKNPRCHYCRNITVLPAYGQRGRRQLLEATLDHAVPQSRGGNDYSANYRLACHTCNNLKGVMGEREFIAELEQAGIREPKK